MATNLRLVVGGKSGAPTENDAQVVAETQTERFRDMKSFFWKNERFFVLALDYPYFLGRYAVFLRSKSTHSWICVGVGRRTYWRETKAIYIDFYDGSEPILLTNDWSSL